MFPYVPLSFFPRGRQYVCGHIRTNTGEGYYSMFKRAYGSQMSLQPGGLRHVGGGDAV